MPSEAFHMVQYHQPFWSQRIGLIQTGGQIVLEGEKNESKESYETGS
jgi:hypothetical protein